MEKKLGIFSAIELIIIEFTHLIENDEQNK